MCGKNAELVIVKQMVHIVLLPPRVKGLKGMRCEKEAGTTSGPIWYWQR
jgi:hypothetical protein